MCLRKVQPLKGGGTCQKEAGFIVSLEVAWLLRREKKQIHMLNISLGKIKATLSLHLSMTWWCFLSLTSQGSRASFFPQALLELFFPVLFSEGTCQRQPGSLQAAWFNQQEWDVPESSDFWGPASWRTQRTYHRSFPASCPVKPKKETQRESGKIRVPHLSLLLFLLIKSIEIGTLCSPKPHTVVAVYSRAPTL